MTSLTNNYFESGMIRISMSGHLQILSETTLRRKGAAESGDVMKLQIKVQDDSIVDASSGHSVADRRLPVRVCPRNG